MKKAKISELKRDENGFPLPGLVVKLYRQQMVYIDVHTGIERHWTQADLGKQLNISELMVRLMETQNKGLESIERRRALVEILKIPPVLLGLATLDELTSFLTKEAGVDNEVKKVPVSSEKTNLYRDVFMVYTEKRARGSITSSISDIEAWVSRIQIDTQNANFPLKESFMQLLWDFHMLLCRVYSYDTCEWSKASNHAEQAVQIASTLGKPDLIASSAYRAGEIQISNRNWQLAYSSFQGILELTKGANYHTKSAIYAYGALTTALTKGDEISVTKAQNLLDLSEKDVRMVDENSGISFDYSSYLLDRADTLICLHRPIAALEYIQEAEKLTDPSSRRDLSYLDILRAESYIKRKKPQYDSALALLKGVVLSDSVEHHIRYIKRLFKIILDSPYGNSPETTELRLLLNRTK